MVICAVDLEINQLLFCFTRKKQRHGNAKHELVVAMNEWLAYHEEMEDWAITTLETYKDKMKTIENYFGEDHEKWMDEEQYKLFRQWLIDNADKYKYQHFKKLIEIVEVLIFTGMRREELAGLRWCNVDLNDGLLYVVETRVRAGNKEYEVFGCKTEESVRKYKLREDMIELFSRIADRQRRLGIYDRNNYVFVWEHDEDNHGIKAGTPYKVDYLTKLFKKAVNECPHVSSKLTLHKTRHSCCSILFSIGWSMAEVQDWLGHKDGSKITEEVYNHFRQVVAVEKIDKFAETLK